MNDLSEQICRRMAVTGPVSLADYMAECLFHPTLGYYTTAAVFGATGDFITAPEVSQMFGELMGLALAQAWVDQSCAAPATLAELGPGRGTLMADLLRATRAVPGMHAALSVNFLEASPQLREQQRTALSGHPTNWIDRIEDLPEAPLFLIANEFFDALPIRQFVRDGSGWRERLVTETDGGLGLCLSEPGRIEALEHRLTDTSDGEVVELCPSLPSVVTEIARRIANHGGCAIVIDYGDWRSRGDTLQALKHHAPVGPFDGPGEADLTAHVDFEAIAAAAIAAGATASPPVAQGVLLERLGITERAQALAKAMPNATALENHIAAHRRLTHPQEMGSLFKAIAIYRPGSPPPPGF